MQCTLATKYSQHYQPIEKTNPQSYQHHSINKLADNRSQLTLFFHQKISCLSTGDVEDNFAALL